MTQTKRASHPKKPSSTGKARPFVLLPRHKQFCRNIVAGMSKTAAFRDAGYSGKWLGGPQNLLKRPAIKDYISVLEEKQRIRLNVTLDSLVLDLRTGQDLAIREANPTAYVAATMGLAKLMGFLKEDRDGDINIYVNRPLREATKELELTPDQWVAKWSPKELVKPNGHGNGEDQG
jgi:hypothetical protein